MSDTEIRPADLHHADTIALFETHVAFAGEQSSACVKHSFDIAQLRGPSVTVWCAWLNDQLMGGGALREVEPTHGQIKAMHTRAAARRLYQRHGFTECAPFGEYEADPEVIFMTRLLSR